jgi:hypothetical protein
MKLRILDDSIRLRLSQAEVGRIADGQGVHSHTRFPDRCMLGYCVESNGRNSITATFVDGVIKVSIPADTAKAWAETDQVSLTAEQPIDGGALSVLIEKDFECLEPRPGDEDHDSFPNPKAR